MQAYNSEEERQKWYSNLRELVGVQKLAEFQQHTHQQVSIRIIPKSIHKCFPAQY